MDRARRRQDADRAYDVQVKAGTEGALRYTALGIGLAIMGHYTWPLFRRQTLAFKGFLVSGFTVFGLVVYAENALQSLESEQRLVESAIRREARLELSRRGLVPTETAIAKWRAEKMSQRTQEASEVPSGSQQPRHE
ncbi:hypothetical protein QCA50_000336 [Cerrena zonata]|uniref:Uncharacterized protein n=1 Tax=Cerrena zonata TaxID=2478898 RepID=A0AAW0GR33_9APHY